jgi:hypothetical protein
MEIGSFQALHSTSSCMNTIFWKLLKIFRNSVDKFSTLLLVQLIWIIFLNSNVEKKFCSIQCRNQYCKPYDRNLSNRNEKNYSEFGEIQVLIENFLLGNICNKIGLEFSMRNGINIYLLDLFAGIAHWLNFCKKYLDLDLNFVFETV